MRKREIEIIIGPDGEITLQVEGASGPECLDLTKDLEEALGLVTSREKTREFYQQPVTRTDHVHAGSGEGEGEG